MFQKFILDESGFIVSSEMVLIATMLVLGLLVGLNTLRNSITSELDDIADAIGNINQDYSYSGLTGHSARPCLTTWKTSAKSAIRFPTPFSCALPRSTAASKADLG